MLAARSRATDLSALAPHAGVLARGLEGAALVGDEAVEDFEAAGGDHLVRLPGLGDVWLCPTLTDGEDGQPRVTLRGLRDLARLFVESREQATAVGNDFGDVDAFEASE